MVLSLAVSFGLIFLRVYWIYSSRADKHARTLEAMRGAMHEIVRAQIYTYNLMVSPMRACVCLPFSVS